MVNFLNDLRYYYTLMINIICITSAILLAVGLSVVAFLMNRRSISLSLPKQILATILACLVFTRYMIEREAVYNVRGLNMFSPFGDEIFLTVLGIILIWFSFSATLNIVLGVFYKFDTLKNLVRFFSLPVLLLDLLCFNVYATAVVGADVFEVFDIRLVFMVLEVGIAIALAVTDIIIDERRELIIPQKSTVKTMLFALPFSLLAIMPAYVPQAIIGFLDPSIKIEGITQEHRIVLYFALIIPFLIFQALKNKSQDVKRFFMIYMSLALLWTYLSYWTFADFANPINWPLHLCNTAMFILPICLIFKLDKVFYFCLFINVLGAFFAMLMPNTDSSVNALGTDRIIFWVNHYPAFFSPILLVALKIFKRPKFREWLYSYVVFSIYFVLVLILNAWFSNFGEPDFFFLNSDFIADKLGDWAENLRNVSIDFNIGELNFKFYPLYQAIFYVAYVLFTFGMWFLYALLFTSWDASEDRRLRERDYQNMKKELLKFLDGKNINEPITGDDSPRLALKHFRKRYGNNKHYSVNDVSFEVRGGEIFGFLGPNGAGKSTIIKSIVGIQTITSGSIEICGYDVEKQPVQSKLNLGFVPDHYALYENLTGREYINYIADLYNIEKEERNNTIEKYVRLFQLTGSFDNQMKTYSHGMKQKIAIMAALVHNPKVWILDEPLTGLDPNSIYEVKECMKDHAARGNIVFFSSHIIDVVEKICDKIAIIKKGKLRAAASVKELDRRGIDLEEFYLNVINSEDNADVISIDGDDIIGSSGEKNDLSGDVGVARA